MPYSSHSVCTPPGECEPLWRYLSFEKFTDLLRLNALHFCRVDKLGDPFEGSYPKGGIVARADFFEARGFHPTIKNTLLKHSRYSRQQFFASCWHRNKYESEAMWKLYAGHGNGVAIRSSLTSFINAFEVSSENIYVSSVDYIDFEQHQPKVLWGGESEGSNQLGADPGGGFRGVLRKSASFQHEQEVRAFAWKPHIVENKIELGHPDQLQSLSVNVNLVSLIDAVYVSPTSSTWYQDVVQEVVRRFDFSFEVEKSSLAYEPCF